MTIKNRSYNATVNLGHSPWLKWVMQLSTVFDEGYIDYASVALERDRNQRLHLQAFVVWNELLAEEKMKPTDKLSGHWTKARSLTGSRDYVTGTGIHYGKPGVELRMEFGEWVDPGWNQSLRLRKIYEFAKRIREDKWSVAQLKTLDPAGVLLLGETNLKSLWTSPFTEMPESYSAPYCYIGRTSLADHLSRVLDFKGAELEQVKESASEEE